MSALLRVSYTKHPVINKRLPLELVAVVHQEKTSVGGRTKSGRLTLEVHFVQIVVFGGGWHAMIASVNQS